MVEALKKQARIDLEKNLKALEKDFMQERTLNNKANKACYKYRYVFFVKNSYNPIIYSSGYPNVMIYHKPKYENHLDLSLFTVYSYNQPKEITKHQLKNFISQKLKIPDGDYFIPLQHEKSKLFNS